MDPVEETVDVAPSEDNGNVPLDAPSLPETPAADPPGDTPTPDPATPADPPAEVLYDLPDGRKVNAETLATEFKENFLPEFTRKSQRLAELEQPPKTDINNQTPKNQFADPDYIPKNYDEIVEEGKRRALVEWEGREKQAIEKQQLIETKVANDIDQIKKLDPNVNTEALFAHAIKYNFEDLTLAHKNMKDMQAAIKTAQTETVKNIAKRNDPVATKPGATGAQLNPRSFSSAVDYLRAIGGQK